MVKEGVKMSLNTDNLFEDRLFNIEEQIKKAVRHKNWAEVKKLRLEKKRVEGIINNTGGR